MAILKPMPHVAKQIQICKNTALTGKSRMKQRHHDTMGILYIEPMSEDGLFPSASFVYLELQKLAKGWEDLHRGTNIFQTYLNILKGENKVLSSNIYENLKLEMRYYIQKLYQNIPTQAKNVEKWYDMISRFEKTASRELEKEVFEKEINHLEILWKAESRLWEQQIYEKWNQLLPMNQEKFHTNRVEETTQNNSTIRENNHGEQFERVKNLIQKEIQREFYKIEYFCKTKDTALYMQNAETKHVMTESDSEINQIDKFRLESHRFEGKAVEKTTENSRKIEDHLSEKIQRETLENKDYDSEYLKIEKNEIDISEIEQYFEYLDADEWLTTIKQLASDVWLSEGNFFTEKLTEKITDVNSQILEIERETGYGTENVSENAQIKLLHVRDLFLSDIQSLELKEQKQLFVGLSQNATVTDIAKQMGINWNKDAAQSGIMMNSPDGMSDIYEKSKAADAYEVGREHSFNEYITLDRELTVKQQIELLQKRDDFLSLALGLSETEQVDLTQAMQQISYTKDLSESLGIDWNQEFDENIETFLTHLDAEEWLHTASELSQAATYLHTDELKKSIYRIYDETDRLLRKVSTESVDKELKQETAVQKINTSEEDTAKFQNVISMHELEYSAIDFTSEVNGGTSVIEGTDNIQLEMEFKTCLEYLEHRIKTDNTKNKSTVSYELKEYYRELKKQVSDKILRELEEVVKQQYTEETEQSAEISKIISTMSQQDKKQLIALLESKKTETNTEKNSNVYLKENSLSQQKTDEILKSHINVETVADITEDNIREVFFSADQRTWLQNLIYLNNHTEEIQSDEFTHMIKQEYDRVHTAIDQVYSQFGIEVQNSVEEYEKLETYSNIRSAKLEFLTQKEKFIQEQKKDFVQNPRGNFTQEQKKDIVQNPRENFTQEQKEDFVQNSRKNFTQEQSEEFIKEQRMNSSEVKDEIIRTELQTKHLDEVKNKASEELMTGVSEETKRKFVEEIEKRFPKEVEEQFDKQMENVQESFNHPIEISEVIDAPILVEWKNSLNTKLEFLKQKDNFIRDIQQDTSYVAEQEQKISETDLKTWIEYLEERSLSQDFEENIAPSAKVQIYYRDNNIDNIPGSVELKKNYDELKEELTKKIWKDLGQFVERHYQSMPFAVKEENRLQMKHISREENSLQSQQTMQSQQSQQTQQTLQKKDIAETLNQVQMTNLLRKAYADQEEKHVHITDTDEAVHHTELRSSLEYMRNFYLQTETEHMDSKNQIQNYDMQKEYSLSYDSLSMPSMVMTRPQPPSFKNMPSSWRENIGQQIEQKTEEVIKKKSIRILDTSEDTMPAADIRQTVQQNVASAWKEKTEELEKKIKIQENLLKDIQDKQINLQSNEVMKKIVENTLKEMHRELKIERMRRGLR